MQQGYRGGNQDEVIAIALGGNMTSAWGEPAQSLARAIERIGDLVGPVTGRSRFYKTPAYPAGSGADFVNAVVTLSDGPEPATLLDILHRIEAEADRVRSGRWAARTLDLDLLCYGQVISPDQQTQIAWQGLAPEDQKSRAPDTLVLPHPRLQDRAFVLVPFKDVAPDWIHPVIGQSVSQMKDALPTADIASIKALN